MTIATAIFPAYYWKGEVSGRTLGGTSPMKLPDGGSNGMHHDGIKLDYLKLPETPLCSIRSGGSNQEVQLVQATPFPPLLGAACLSRH